MGLSKHNKKVKQIASGLASQGYKVQKHLPGSKRPGMRNGHIPDIIAKKGMASVIVEVDQQKPTEHDKKQAQAFRKYANEHPNVKFRKFKC